jgi:hypothetical protein
MVMVIVVVGTNNATSFFSGEKSKRSGIVHYTPTCASAHK